MKIMAYSGTRRQRGVAYFVESIFVQLGGLIVGILAFVVMMSLAAYAFSLTSTINQKLLDKVCPIVVPVTIVLGSTPFVAPYTACTGHVS